MVYILGNGFGLEVFLARLDWILLSYVDFWGGKGVLFNHFADLEFLYQV